MTSPCHDIADPLVDYADNDLPPNETDAVAAHLDSCEDCRSTLANLQRSLELTRVVWADNLACDDTSDATLNITRAPSRPTRRVRSAAGLITAGIAALIITGVFLAPPPTREIPVAPTPTTHNLNEIKNQIARAGVAMQMLMAADLLAEQPGGRDFACERYRYLLAAYPETEAAAESNQRLAEICPERNQS